MYSSYKTFTIQCASGTSGPDVTQGASADSAISQVDADQKALGLATRLAYEFLVCQFPPDPDVVVYCSIPVTKTASAESGYQPQTFTVSYDACAIYSLTSQADADAAAALAAQFEVNHDRDIGQKLIFYSTEQSYTSSCVAVVGPNHDPLTVTITKTAAAYTSNTSQAAADYIAYNAAKALCVATLITTCVPFWYSAQVSYTASCVSPLVGTPVKVSYAVGHVKSYVSQADADAVALAQATAAAAALLTCISGFYNTSQSFTATCLGEYGINWLGSNVTVTIPAGTYNDTTLAAANATALAQATLQASAALICVWGGGIMP